MGWVFREGLSRKDLVNERIHRQWPSGYSGLCMARSLRGNVLWTVWELSKPDGSKDRFIGCDLLGRSRGRGWGYQEMEESGDPCFHSCPLVYLDLVPAVNGRFFACAAVRFTAQRRFIASARRLRPSGVMPPWGLVSANELVAGAGAVAGSPLAPESSRRAVNARSIAAFCASS